MYHFLLTFYLRTLILLYLQKPAWFFWFYKWTKTAKTPCLCGLWALSYYNARVDSADDSSSFHSFKPPISWQCAKILLVFARIPKICWKRPVQTKGPGPEIFPAGAVYSKDFSSTGRQTLFFIPNCTGKSYMKCLLLDEDALRYLLVARPMY